MKIGFVLFHYFPYGGLERDMLAIARACAAREHDITIFTQDWQGDKPEFTVVELPVTGITNHARGQAFAQQFQITRQHKPMDVIVGFNKMPGLDVYFAADVCFAQKAYEERSWWYRLSGRSRSYLRLEQAVFGIDSKTQILLISPAQIAPFQRHYQTPNSRLHMLPPGIRRDRIMPTDYEEQRSRLRSQYGLTKQDYIMLMVGSDYQRKGLARSIQALAALPAELAKHTQLWVAGLDKPRKFIKLAKKLGVATQLKVLGARDDIEHLMWSADVFLHPAYTEAAGAVLLEAMVAGLPVITTDVCGYSYYVTQQHMGAVLNSTAADSQLATTIAKIAAEDAQQWREKAHHFAKHEDIFSMTKHAAQLIEQAANVNQQAK